MAGADIEKALCLEHTEQISCSPLLLECFPAYLLTPEDRLEKVYPRFFYRGF